MWGKVKYFILFFEKNKLRFNFDKVWSDVHYIAISDFLKTFRLRASMTIHDRHPVLLFGYREQPEATKCVMHILRENLTK